MFLIVPDSLRHSINAKLDAAIRDCPSAASERKQLFNQLVLHFHVHGVVPDFTISPPAEEAA